MNRDPLWLRAIEETGRGITWMLIGGAVVIVALVGVVVWLAARN